MGCHLAASVPGKTFFAKPMCKQLLFFASSVLWGVPRQRDSLTPPSGCWLPVSPATCRGHTVTGCLPGLITVRDRDHGQPNRPARPMRTLRHGFQGGLGVTSGQLGVAPGQDADWPNVFIELTSSCAMGCARDAARARVGASRGHSDRSLAPSVTEGRFF